MSTKIKKALQRYPNTLFFSVDDRDGKEEVLNDLMLEGDIRLIAAGLAQQMVRHPELVWLFEESLQFYDQIKADATPDTTRG